MKFAIYQNGNQTVRKDDGMKGSDHLNIKAGTWNRLTAGMKLHLLRAAAGEKKKSEPLARIRLKS